MFGKTITHAIKHQFGLEAPHSQVSEAERECLKKLVQGKSTAVEIGVYEGATTALLAQSMDKDGILYAIDPFIPGRLGICWGKMVAYREVKRLANGATVKFVEHYSYEAIALVDGLLDFIFIDGDHSWEGISRDWVDWAERVQVGGIIALHDTKVPAHNPNVANLGSFKYFEEHIRHDDRFELVKQVDSLSVLRRL